MEAMSAFLPPKLGLKIKKLIILGTPICLEYLPDLRNIGMIYNVFFTADLVQTSEGTIPNLRARGGRSVA